ncbi:hypothetical protein M4951_04365 [Blastopirellula sp. J2-11]|uniref:hypothetical protein n=1 Tax=Blastopirellula sp. J2-11 TaxID=2943192 RepID=UPI0021C77093|nr:hypothetical protein [Blastopirellula sp. J2-11]UUO07546.1 hypothetical protein M4951_04365 [Blastopirellula sp. J2-11]
MRKINECRLIFAASSSDVRQLRGFPTATISTIDLIHELVFGRFLFVEESSSGHCLIVENAACFFFVSQLRTALHEAKVLEYSRIISPHQSYDITVRKTIQNEISISDSRQPSHKGVRFEAKAFAREVHNVTMDLVDTVLLFVPDLKLRNDIDEIRRSIQA